MAVHWTYQDIGAAGGDLEQGDILYPSEDLLALFRDEHPYFFKDEFLGFMVASQSCDLVRRKGGVKASFISLSAIRPLSKMMPTLIAQVASPVAPSRFPVSGIEGAKQLLERIFNQNEQSIGLFFLFPDADLKLGEEAVATLRVTVPVSSAQYDVLTRSRVGRLKPEFQAKLGWLLGNLYNRPATPDWADFPGGKEKFDGLVSRFSKGNEGDANVEWIEDLLIQEARRIGRSLEEASLEELESLRPPPTMDRALDEINAQLSKVLPEVDSEVLVKFRNRLKNSGKFKKLLVS